MFERRVKWIKWIFFLLLLGVPVRLTWLQLVWRNQLLYHPYNARLQERVSQRGRIYDRQGRVLASSQHERRVYPEGSLSAHWTGFHSAELGSSGTEAWKDALLGEHRDAPGSGLPGAGNPGRPVYLSLDLEAQRGLEKIFPAGESGAAVLVDLDSAQVLAAISHPHFDPNRVAVEWRNWQNAEEAPTLSRFGLGLYPAGALWSAWEADFRQLPQRPASLLDWAGPHLLGTHDWLVSPMSVAAVLQRQGSPLLLSQLRHRHQQRWQPGESFRRLGWRRSRSGWSWTGTARQGAQTVQWALRVSPPWALVMLCEQPCPDLGRQAGYLPLPLPFSSSGSGGGGGLGTGQ